MQEDGHRQKNVRCLVRELEPQGHMLVDAIFFGDVRWDGRNKGVTKADLEFLLARKSKW